ncbi:Disease resistance RPP13-like protein [Actinidia chinensis var. chinensis]|uniref:Disease resistance RPP13-like protein n=1 Tax=Actinidia chinensis var. chinensis TaxID=1590841 RepID=A0A2R6QA28_ACTCC|nr:Disease resistance RPP13-like protein [Actinidia chinensis var. chinensis]
MPTKTASDLPSSSTSTEIVPVEDDTTTTTNNKETEKPKSEVSDQPKSNETEPRSNEPPNSDEKAEALCKLVKADLDFVNASSERIQKYKPYIEEVSAMYEKLKKEGGTESDFRKLKEILKKLKQKTSSKQKDETEDADVLHHLLSSFGANVTGTNARDVLDKMPNLIKDAAFEQSEEFKELEARYHELGMELKLCLLCFSVFPENEVIKKRVMIYWWIGEGFAPPVRRENNDNRTAEQFANDYFSELLEKGFIEPVREKRSLRVDACKMHPFVRAMVIKLANRAKFFDFDEEGNGKEDYDHSLRACLTGKRLLNDKNFENLHALFNVNEAILEFNPEWFAKMKNVNVLYLGRWQASAVHHIEIEDTKTLKIKNANVLDGLENVKHLRFLSLQGISRISALPESISKLANLTILDIRACHNLEVIPNGIGLLKNLTHLDMSECYLLDQMPNGLALLSKLEVLSGFVVGDSAGTNSCSLNDLRKLTNLRKLSIHTGVNDFPSEEDLRALNQYKKLTKLTIAWGRGSVQAKRDDTVTIDNSGANLATETINNAEYGTAASKKLVAQRSLARSSTSKQSAEIPTREIREDNKKKGVNEAEQALVAQRSLTRSSTSKQSSENPTREIREDNEGKGIKEPEQMTETSKKSVAFATDTETRKIREDSKNKDISGQATAALKKSISKISLKSLKSKADRPDRPVPPVLPSQLTKLDLQCFPGMITHKWLRARNLKELTKLYIRGGKFCDLGQFQDLDDDEAAVERNEKEKWGVKELRLKYLTELDMDWRELQELFPNLYYLEMVKCPKLTFFPCDESGVWMNKKKKR